MNRLPIILWIASLGLLLFALGNNSVQRTQEARVMETARESLDTGTLRGWLIPQCNGQPRLRKPPLAYWLTGLAFEIGGVNSFAGRLPMALVGWLTVGLTYCVASRWAHPIAGLLSAAILLGSFLFFKSARLAETDILITLFISAAVYSICRAIDQPAHERRWLLLSGVMVGLTLIGKGMPAIFPLLFLLGIAWLDKRWDYLFVWLKSGAPIAALLVGGWWWLYIGMTPEYRKVFQDEAFDALEGRGHTQLFWAYGPILLKATAPWCGVGVAALVVAIRNCKHNVVDRRLLLWITSILFPLCCIGQKQDHYVLPLMPPLAIMTGAWLYRVANDVAGTHRSVAKTILLITLGIVSLAPIALPLIGQYSRDRHEASDFIVAGLMLIGVAITWWTFIRFNLQRAAVTFAIVVAICISPLFGLWAPSLRETSPRDIAMRLNDKVHDPNARYVFYGENLSLPLVYEMRRVIPIISAPGELSNERAKAGPLIVLAQTKSDRQPPRVPPGFTTIDEFRSEDQTFKVYRSND